MIHKKISQTVEALERVINYTFIHIPEKHFFSVVDE